MKKFMIMVTIVLMALSMGVQGAALEAAADKDLFFDVDEALFAEMDDLEASSGAVSDPLSGLNRCIFQFNDKFYFWVLKPAARGYRAVMPLGARQGLDNFFFNLKFPVRLTSSIFQGKWQGAMDETAIFIVNTTAGCLGFTKPAQEVFELENCDEDLGQTLGYYSINQGFYLVFPFIGPSTCRDAVGSMGDYFLTPVNYVRPQALATGISALNMVNGTSLQIGAYEALKNAAIDPYLAVKDAYIQRRTKKIEE